MNLQLFDENYSAGIRNGPAKNPDADKSGNNFP